MKNEVELESYVKFYIVAFTRDGTEVWLQCGRGHYFKRHTQERKPFSTHSAAHKRIWTIQQSAKGDWFFDYGVVKITHTEEIMKSLRKDK